MRSAVRRSLAVAALATVPVLTASPALADPAGTPAGTGGGCKTNGQALATAAGPGFGTFVSTQTPIADDVAAFFTVLCA